MNAHKLLATLPTIADPLTDEAHPAPAFIDHDTGELCISAEHESSWLFLDYYGEYRGGYPYIAPELDAWAAKHGAFWDWLHPGAIVLAR